uniref:Uncharacterized protein n=1 Tax=Rhizophora mucronata TaxID=61149 RepID=A0A2P2QAH7_RHIMU
MAILKHPNYFTKSMRHQFH